MILTHGINSIPRYVQAWDNDPDVTTSLNHSIPIDSCGIEIGLNGVRELPYMNTLDESCGIEIGLNGVRELPYMNTLDESCGIEMGLISINEIGEVYSENIGGTTYKTVLMPDGKVWMAENLDYKFNGCIIGATDTSSVEPRANYYDNDEPTYGRSGYKCGLLYNWRAVKYLNDNKASLIPGWHVPTADEWNALAASVGGTSTAGTILKASSVSWASEWSGNDDYGFAILPSGASYHQTTVEPILFSAIGNSGAFWTASSAYKEEIRASGVGFMKDSSAMVSSQEEWLSTGHSLRLVKD